MQSENILHEYFAMESALYMDLTSIKCDSFVNLSTTTMMDSWCIQIIGNPVLKFMEINSHFHLELAKVAKTLLGVNAQPSPADISCTLKYT